MFPRVKFRLHFKLGFFLYLPSFIGPWLSRNNEFIPAAVKSYGLLKNVRTQWVDSRIFFRKKSRTIVISQSHSAYAKDLIDEFDFYFSSVVLGKDENTIDFSSPSTVALAGWKEIPVEIPSLPEPISTVEQYVSLTGMSKSNVILDLGAYSGVTSMFFQEVVGKQGKVIAIDADPINLSCAEINFSRFFDKYGYKPTLVDAAVWSENGTLEFASEGSLGSAVAEIQSRETKETITVRSVTLSQIVDEQNLNKVDVIKADIEGAEFFAFSDKAFFSNFHPVIVFEPAMNSNPETKMPRIEKLLESYGYKLSYHNQIGSRIPLALAK